MPITSMSFTHKSGLKSTLHKGQASAKRPVSLTYRKGDTVKFVDYTLEEWQELYSFITLFNTKAEIY